MRLRPATLADARILWRIRNDPHTRAMSKDTRRIAYRAHLAWLTKRLSLTTDWGRIYVAWSGDEAVGAGRLDIGSETAAVSFAVAPVHRRSGFGRAILYALVRRARRLGVKKLVMVIRVENEASIRTALHARFRPATNFVTFSKELA